MRNRFGVLAIVSVLSTSALPAQGRSLASIDSLWARNYAVHDTTTAMQLMADDFFMTSSNGRVKTREQEMADIRPSSQWTVDYFRTEEVRIREYGNAGVATGVLAWSTTSNGRSSAIRRRYTATYTKGGPLGWRMVALHVGPAPTN